MVEASPNASACDGKSYQLRQHVDKFYGFSLDIPQAWRTAFVDGKIIACDERAIETSVVIWPVTLPRPMSALDVVGAIVQTAVNAEPRTNAWTSPSKKSGSDEEQMAIYDTFSLNNVQVRGAVRVVVRDGVHALATCVQVPLSELAKLHMVEAIASSFKFVAPIEKASFIDPTENAFSLAYPKGWVASGGVNRQTFGKHIWAVEDTATRAKVYNNAAWIEFIYFPSMGMGAHGQYNPYNQYNPYGQNPYGQFNPFNPYGGMSQMMYNQYMSNPQTAWLVQPYMNADDLVRNVILPRARQSHPDISLIAILPDVVSDAKNRIEMRQHLISMQTTGVTSACLALTTFAEGGIRFKELASVTTFMFANPPTMIDAGQKWFGVIGPGMRAPENVFDDMLPVLMGIASSFKVNPAWQAAENRATQAQIAALQRDRQRRLREISQTLSETTEMITKGYEARTQIMDDIGRRAGNVAGGWEDVRNEFGESWKVNSGYDSYWEKNGQVVGTNSAFADSELGANGWKRLTIY